MYIQKWVKYLMIGWTWKNKMNEESNGAVEISRGLYPNDTTNKTVVVSTLIY